MKEGRISVLPLNSSMPLRFPKEVVQEAARHRSECLKKLGRLFGITGIWTAIKPECGRDCPECAEKQGQRWVLRWGDPSGREGGPG